MDKVYLIQEPFISLQSSGPLVGRKALFLCLAADGSKIYRKTDDLVEYADSQKPLDLVVFLVSNSVNRDTFKNAVETFMSGGFRVEVEVLGAFLTLGIPGVLYNINLKLENFKPTDLTSYLRHLEDGEEEFSFKFYVAHPDDFMAVKTNWQTPLDIPDSFIYIVPVVPDGADELKRAEIEAWSRERCCIYNYTLCFGRI